MTEQLGGSMDPRRLGERRVGRRSLIKWAFGATATAAVAKLASPALAETLAQSSAGGQSLINADPSQEMANAAANNPPKRLRRWAMLIDLRSCDGCQSVDKPPQCTEACIQAHFAPQPMEWIQIYESELPGKGTQFIPAPCQQCQNSPCTNVCPVGATFQTPEGVVLIDQLRCIGCRICMEACPYDRRFFNWGQPAQPPESMFREYNPEHQSVAIKGTVMKCDFCTDMARAGRAPYCAAGCPNHAIYYGDLEEDLATNGVQVVSLSRFRAENAAYRLKENLGTQPRVYYIPGHGENVGRDPFKKGRKPTVWPWQKTIQGGETWNR